MSCFELGNAFYASNDISSAQKYYEAGLYVKELVIKEKPTLLQRRDLIKDYNYMGNITKNAKKEFAEKCFKKAFSIIFEIAYGEENGTYRSKEDFLQDYTLTQNNLFSVAENFITKIKYLFWIMKCAGANKRKDKRDKI